MLSPAERGLLLTAARVVLDSRQGTLAEQMARADGGDDAARRREPYRAAPRGNEAEPMSPGPALEFGNGLGGFADGGREYAIGLGAGQWTPRRGSTWWPTSASASRCRSRVRATRGR